jgi:transcriptional regulator GlxA family with amidase domain
MSLLDGKSATTNWWLAPLFRELYPRVKLEESRMVVDSSRFVTAGSALAHIDLALWLVRRASPSLANDTSRFLVTDPRTSQAAYMIPKYLAHTDPLIEHFEKWARQSLAEGFSLSKAAKAAGTSERTLARRLQTVLGKTPLAYFQDLRIEQVTYLLRTSNESIDQIAYKVGYSNGKTLRALIHKKTGRSIKEFRVGN